METKKRLGRPPLPKKRFIKIIITQLDIETFFNLQGIVNNEKYISKNQSDIVRMCINYFHNKMIKNI